VGQRGLLCENHHGRSRLHNNGVFSFHCPFVGFQLEVEIVENSIFNPGEFDHLDLYCSFDISGLRIWISNIKIFRILNLKKWIFWTKKVKIFRITFEFKSVFLI
jgi:hypothetical protein